MKRRFGIAWFLALALEACAGVRSPAPSTGPMIGTSSASPRPASCPEGSTYQTGACRDQAHLIGAGWLHVCAIEGHGRVACWGDNAWRQLGRPTPVRSGSPIPVLEDSEAVSIAASRGASTPASCAVTAEGRVYCWGAKERRCTGVGCAEPKPVPGIEDAEEIAMSRDFACVRRRSAPVTCWACGNDGCWSEQEQIPSLPDVAQIAAGSARACVRTRSGKVLCIRTRQGTWDWQRHEPQLADPEPVGGLEEAVDVAVGETQACAVRGDGAVVCWGGEALGKSVPVAGIPFATRIAVGRAHACALERDGTVACWGRADEGQLGRGRIMTGRASPAASLVHDAVEIAAGADFTCARLANGSYTCWGSNENGTAGNGALGALASPTPVPGLTDVVEVAAGAEHTCALRKTGTVECWGWGSTFAEVADPDDHAPPEPRRQRAAPPVPVVGASDIRAISASERATCAVRHSGELLCWGPGVQASVSLPKLPGQPGYAAKVPGVGGVCSVTLLGRQGGVTLCDGRAARFSPLDTQPPLFLPGIDRALEVTVGRDRTLIVTRDQQAFVYGTSPAVLERVVAIRGDAMALLADGTVKRLLRGTPGPRLVTEPVIGIADAASIAVFGTQICGRLRSGHVRCRGANAHGELGTGQYGTSASGDTVVGIDDAVSVTVGHEHACAARRTGQVVCWGSNMRDQLGIADPGLYVAPVPVSVWH